PAPIKRTGFVSDLAIRAVDKAPLHHGLEHAPLHRAAVERRILGFRAKAADVDATGPIEIEQHEVRRGSRGEAASREPEDFRRAVGSAGAGPEAGSGACWGGAPG